MPIYEFKCLKCNEFIEILILNKSQSVEMRCPKCSSEDLERVLSSAHYNMGGRCAARTGVSSQTRTCSGGSCTTYDLPGPND